MQDEELDDVLFEFPRKCLKSSIVTSRGPIYRLMRRVHRGEDPYDRNFILSHGFKVAQLHWWETKEVFENDNDSGQLFRFLWPELRPSDKWNEEIGSLVRDWDRKDKTFEPLAKRSAGKHCDLVSCDDLIDEENYDEPTAVEKAKIFREFTNNWLEGSAGVRWTVGNRWGMDDLNSAIHEQAAESGTVIFSVDLEEGVNWPGEGNPYGCQNLPEYMHEFCEILDATAEKYGSIWPERMTPSYIKKLKGSMRPVIWASQYKNKPEDPEAMEFDASMVDRHKLVYVENSGPAVHRIRENELVPLSDMNLYVTWDPALDEKQSKSENAVLLTGVDSKDRGYVIKEDVSRCDPYRAMNRFLAFLRYFEGYIQRSGVEEVLFQKLLKRDLIDRAQKRGVYLGIQKVNTPRGKTKEQTIRMWIGVRVEGRKLSIGIECPKTYNQIRLFGVKGANTDALDALKIATRMWEVPLTQEQQEEMMEEEEQQLVDMGVTGYGDVR
jgi:hypothetical protein